MKDLVQEIKTRKFETNEKGELKQNVRNAYRAELTQAFGDFLNEHGLENKLTLKGIGFEFQNDELGSVPFELSVTIKTSDYVLDEEHEAYLEKIAEREAKEKAKAEAKAKRNAKKTT